MSGVLSLARDGERILLIMDSTPAVKILQRRWSKKNERINSYIARFDYICTTRNIHVQVEHAGRQGNWAAHFLAYNRIDLASKHQKLTKEKKLTVISPFF
jgi:ribonuclease HI